MTTQKHEWRLVGVPLDCSGRFIGVERMPAALRTAGLVEQLGVHDAGDLAVSIADAVRDPVTGMIGFADVGASAAAIRTALSGHLADGARPLVIGGDCTLLIGVAAALRDHFGRVGLAFVDGHLDFYDGKSSPTGEAADMELAILCGWGPAGLVDLGGPPPLLDPADLFVLGYRDGEQAAADGAPDPRAVAGKMALYDAETLRRYGYAAAGSAVEERFRFDPGYFWLHLDLDVLDESVMPAVDYRMPGGLSWEALAALTRPLVHSPSLIGMDVTIFNPTLDPDGRHASEIVAFLRDLLDRRP